MTNETYDAIIKEVERHIERAKVLKKLIKLDQMDAWVNVYIDVGYLKCGTEHPEDLMEAVHYLLPKVGRPYEYINVGSFVDDGTRGYYAENTEFFEYVNE